MKHKKTFKLEKLLKKMDVKEYNKYVMNFLYNDANALPIGKQNSSQILESEYDNLDFQELERMSLENEENLKIIKQS